MRVRLLAGVLALVTASWLLWTFHDRFWYPPDEGNYAHVAARLLAGETLNLDVQDIHPGYINFVNAAALWAFGADLVSLRYPIVLAGLVQALAIVLIFPRQRPWRAALAAISLTALGAIQFLNPTAHWYCLALVVLLIATLDVARREARWLVLVGVLVGAIVLFRQLTGFFAGVGVLTFLLWHAGEDGGGGSTAALGRTLTLMMMAALVAYLALATDVSGIVLFGLGPVLLLARLFMRPQAPNREVLRIVSAVAAGVAIAALPLVAYHGSHGSIRAWLNDVGPAAVALTQLDFFDRSNFGALVFQAMRQGVGGGTPATLLNSFYWTVLPMLALANGIAVWRLLRRPGTAAGRALPMVAVFYAMVSVHFQIPVYLYYSAGLSLASLLYLTPDLPLVAARGLPPLAAALSAIAVAFQAGQPASRGIPGILRGERAPAMERSTLPHNSLRIGADDASLYGKLLDTICHEVPEGEAMLAVPSNAELYFLSGRRNPFRFYNTALGVRDAATLASVERTLEDTRPKLVTFNREDKYNTPASLRIMETVKRRYVLLGRFESFDVYVLP